MAINFPAPYAIKLEYTQDGITHAMLLPVNIIGTPTVGDPFEDIDVMRNSGVPLDLKAAVDTWLVVLADIHANTTTFDNITLLGYVGESFESFFVSAYTPDTTIAGASAVGVKQTRYTMLTFRSAEGGIAKHVFLEPVEAFDSQVGYAGMNGNYQAYSDYVADTNGFFLARDTSRLIAVHRLSGGQNEKIWRMRFRP